MKDCTALLTGLPRSGTTLTCELLNMVPDSVSLDEPMTWASFTGQADAGLARSRSEHGLGRLAGRLRQRVRLPPAASARPPDLDDVCDNIERFCDEARHSITSRGVAVSRHVDGKVLGSKVADRTTESGLRARLAEWGEIAVDKELSPNFLLSIKHTSAFTALLDRLVDRFRVYAIVRNPLSVLTSWQTVPFPPQQGHVQMGEAFDADLAGTLARIDDRLDRQMHLLGWFFGRFHDLLPATSVVRYEDLTASGGGALRVVTERAADLQVPLENRNRGRAAYDKAPVAALAERLLATPGPWWHFYTPESVQEILAD